MRLVAAPNGHEEHTPSLLCSHVLGLAQLLWEQGARHGGKVGRRTARAFSMRRRSYKWPVRSDTTGSSGGDPETGQRETAGVSVGAALRTPRKTLSETHLRRTWRPEQPAEAVCLCHVTGSVQHASRCTKRFGEEGWSAVVGGTPQRRSIPPAETIGCAASLVLDHAPLNARRCRPWRCHRIYCWGHTMAYRALAVRGASPSACASPQKVACSHAAASPVTWAHWGSRRVRRADDTSLLLWRSSHLARASSQDGDGSGGRDSRPAPSFPSIQGVNSAEDATATLDAAGTSLAAVVSRLSSETRLPPSLVPPLLALPSTAAGGGAVEAAAEGLLVWRRNLQRGLLPPEDVEWPRDAVFRTAVLGVFADLDMARFTRRHPALLDTVLANVLDLLAKYEANRKKDKIKVIQVSKQS